MKKINNIKIIIFDCDGVLVDSFNLLFKAIQSAEPWLTEDEFKDRFLDNYYKHKVKTKPLIPLDELLIKYSKKAKNQNITASTKKTLVELSKTFNLAIISSNYTYIIKDILEHNKILNLFTKLYGGDIEKSKVKKFKLVLKDNNVLPSQCIFITDTLGDILEAKKAGIHSLAYYGPESYHTKKVLERGNPYGIINKLSDIKKYISEDNF